MKYLRVLAVLYCFTMVHSALEAQYSFVLPEEIYFCCATLLF
jgi:hypothetical protein